MPISISASEKSVSTTSSGWKKQQPPQKYFQSFQILCEYQSDCYSIEIEHYHDFRSPKSNYHKDWDDYSSI